MFEIHHICDSAKTPSEVGIFVFLALTQAYSMITLGSEESEFKTCTSEKVSSL